jgi:hypothetical protein
VVDLRVRGEEESQTGGPLVFSRSLSLSTLCLSLFQSHHLPHRAGDNAAPADVPDDARVGCVIGVEDVPAVPVGARDPHVGAVAVVAAGGEKWGKARGGERG